MNKFKKIREKLKNDYMLFQNYGFNFAKDDFELQFIYRNPKSEKTKKKIRIKHERVIKYLKSNYLEYIERNRKETDESEYIEENCNIYIFWWQGFENAPDIVKSCLNSVKNNRGMHKIILIDKNNYDQYIKLPDYIIDKLNKNIISLTHFSDILRVSLLYKYGGIWLDATIFLKNVLDKSIYNYKLYTVKHQLYKDFHVCRGMWTDSCFMAGKNNLLMKYLRNFFLNIGKKKII